MLFNFVNKEQINCMYVYTTVIIILTWKKININIVLFSKSLLVIKITFGYKDKKK